jgi:hypothetical protein
MKSDTLKKKATISGGVEVLMLTLISNEVLPFYTQFTVFNNC